MKKIILAILLFISFSTFAQENEDSSRTGSFHFYFGFAACFQNFDKLNDRLALRPEYQSVNDMLVPGFTIGWVKEKARVISDFHFSFYGGKKGNVEKKSSRLKSTEFSLLYGYNVLKSQKVRLYPFAGVSFQTFKAKLNKDLSGIPFDSVLVSPTVSQRIEPVSFANSFWGYRAGIGIDLLGKEGKPGALGFRVGYVGSFDSNDWRVNNDQVLLNAPKDRLSGFYASLLFMMGRRR